MTKNVKKKLFLRIGSPIIEYVSKLLKVTWWMKQLIFNCFFFCDNMFI